MFKLKTVSISVEYYKTNIKPIFDIETNDIFFNLHILIPAVSLHHGWHQTLKYTTSGVGATTAVHWELATGSGINLSADEGGSVKTCPEV